MGDKVFVYLLVEPQVPVQMASLSIRHHLAVCAVVLRVPLSYRNHRRDDAGTGTHS